MNKIKYFLLLPIATLALGAGSAMASPLTANFVSSLDTTAAYGSPSHDAIARAELNLNLASSPDIEAHFLMATYTAVSGLLTVDGWGLTYFDGTSSTPLINEAFSLTALVDAAGNLTAGPASIFSIGGLLAGSILDIGFSNAPDSALEFLFSVTGGSLAADFGGIDALGGMIMTLIDFPGDWTNDWSGSFGVVDVVAVAASEPGILLLGGLGLTLLVAARRRKI